MADPRRRWRQLLGWGVALGVCAAPACGDGKKAQDQVKLRHDRGDAAPVVIVDDKSALSSGKTISEVEPNESAESATALAVPATAQGSLATDKDFDVFAVAADKDGALSARLSGIDGVDLVLELRDKEGNVLARSDTGPAKADEGIPNYPVARGKTYFLTVTELAKKSKKGKTSEPGRTSASAPYSLRASVDVPPDNQEREPNEDVARARSVMLGDAYSGWIGWSKDVDVWTLDLTGFSGTHALDIEVSGVEGVGLRLELLDSGGKTVWKAEGDRGAPMMARGIVPAQGQPFYAARLSSARANPREPYSIRTASRPLTEDDEREPNGEAEQATLLRADPARMQGVMRGALAGKDVDYYRFEAGAAAVRLDVSVSREAGPDIKLTVRANGVTISSLAGKQGQVAELLATLVSANAVAFIVVEGGSAGKDYELKWTVWPATPSSPEIPPVDPQKPDPSDEFGDDFD